MSSTTSPSQLFEAKPTKSRSPSVQRENLKFSQSSPACLEDIGISASSDYASIRHIVHIHDANAAAKQGLSSQKKFTVAAADHDEECKTPEIENKTSKATVWKILTSSADASESEEIEIGTFAERELLQKHGLILETEVCDILQGKLLEARDASRNDCTVVLKKTDKALYRKRISLQQGMSVVVDEDACKEAIIMHHLTVDNRPICDTMQRFVQFFESDVAFYLVMEKAGDQSLQQFSDEAHKHIANGKLKIKAWRKAVKYIFWQMALMLYWLHHDMHCCVLRLSMSGIMVTNGKFIENAEDGSITVDPNIAVKISDFGVSEVFKCDKMEHGISDVDASYSYAEEKQVDEDDEDPEDDEYAGNDFKCSKFGIVDHDSDFLLPPKLFNEEAFDARKADVWSLGVILYELLSGLKPCVSCSPYDEQFRMIKTNYLHHLILQQHCSKFFNTKLVMLLQSLLSVDEKMRYSCADILKHEWMSLYFTKYQSQIMKKTQTQIAQNQKLEQKMKVFPYYEEIG